VVAWSGIKRAGGASIMGQAAAQNIYASMLNSELPPSTTETEKCPFSELPAWEAVMGLAIGKQCLVYDTANGMRYGVEVMQKHFGDDLNFNASLKFLELTDIVEKGSDISIDEVEKAKMVEVGDKLAEAIA
jgi:hypothetical protein